MRINGAQFTVAVIALLLSAALLYVGKFPLEVVIAIFFTVIGYYFGGVRGVYNKRGKRGG